MSTTMKRKSADDRVRVCEDLAGWICVRSQTSSVTTAWGVNWDEEAVARDLMQNFYDANRDDLEKVVVRREKGNVVVVEAPAVFELDRLLYLGSEKDKDENVGQYGEGFKAAVLALIRDHKIEPVVVSGDHATRIRASEKAVEGTKLIPIVYDFFDAPTGYKDEGTRLVLNGCSAKLAAAVEHGLAHFWHEGNPLVGKVLWTNRKGDVSLYQAAEGSTDGVIFYRRLKRGVIPSIPVVLVIDKPYEAIEKKTRQDRDRLAFGPELAAAAYRAFAGALKYWEPDPVSEIVRRAAPVWKDGHALLSAVAAKSAAERWNETGLVASVFGKPKSYYAAVSRQHVSVDVFLQVQPIEEEWRRAGRSELPSYFSSFGIENALGERVRRQEADRSRKQRKPTAAESEALGVLLETSRELAPDVRKIFKEERTEYAIALSDELLGEFRRGRHHGSTTIFLSEDLFAGDFAQAIATYLHEHAHVFGHDASRAFTDALTTMIESCIRLREGIDKYEKAWAAVRSRILAEREAGAGQAAESVDEVVAAMDEGALRELVARIPAEVVRSAIRREERKKKRKR